MWQLQESQAHVPSGAPLNVLPRGRVRLEDVDTLSHTTWDCKYHVVCMPKYRRKALYPEIPAELKRR